MIESKEVKYIKRLRDDAKEREMEPLLLCYQQWLLRTMIAEVVEVIKKWR